ncbi:MAG: methyl-accepting chemotaxis protein [Pseudomonadota bacterium]
MIISNLKIGTRLGLGFTLVTLLAVLNGGVAYYNLGKTGALWADFEANALRKHELGMQGKVKLGEAVQDFKNFILRGRDYADKFRNNLDAIGTIGDAYAQLPTNAHEQALLLELRTGLDNYRAAMKQLVSLKDGGAAVTELDGAVGGADKPIHAALDGLVGIARKDTAADGAQIASTVLSSERVILGLTLVGMLLAALFSVLVTRSIVRPMRRAVKIAQAVAQGDLTTSIEARYTDETGLLLKALKEMNESLQRIVSEVRGGTDTMAASSQQIASGNADLSARTEEQASSLEETASSMEELTSTVQENFNHAQLASSLAQTTAINAGKSGAAVGQVVTTMAAINSASRKIVDIISVIDGIAFQTNILALNAAVEAARAGEQGRGFAVVAGEVRSLAQRAATAAKEIKVLIDESVSSVEQGARLADAAGASMQEVVTGIARVATIVGEIATAAREQSASIEEVSQAVIQMDEMTQQNAALVEESAAASMSLQERALGLARVVSVFRLEAPKPGAARGQLALYTGAPETHELASDSGSDFRRPSRNTSKR